MTPVPRRREAVLADRPCAAGPTDHRGMGRILGRMAHGRDLAGHTGTWGGSHHGSYPKA